MTTETWPALKRLSYVLDDATFNVVLHRVDPHLTEISGGDAFRDAYRRHFCDSTGWPKEFPLISENSVTEGIRIVSNSGKIQGRTTGSRRKCAAEKCPGWFIGVLWETGQQMYLCSEGWHYTPVDLQSTDPIPRIDIIGGGEISARFVSPKPLGVNPLPRTEWPTKSELRTRRGWRVNP